MATELTQGQTAEALLFLMVQSSDHLTGAEGLSPTVTIGKNGAALAPPAGAVTEVGSGWYALAGNATDENMVGPLLLHAESAGADPCDKEWRVVAAPATASAVSAVASTLSDIKGAGWTNQTLVALKAALTALPADLLAALRAIAPGVDNLLAGANWPIWRGEDNSITLGSAESPLDLTDAASVIVLVKTSAGARDEDALLGFRWDTGGVNSLYLLNGGTPGAGETGTCVPDIGAGTIPLTLKAEAAVALAERHAVYGVQVITNAGARRPAVDAGTVQIASRVNRVLA